MKILVVDDNAVNVHLLDSMLKRYKHEVLKASNGFEAVEIFETQRPDLVLMDIMMPGMDGRECATRLKQLAGDVYIPIIYVTALSQEAALSTALSAGGDDFVSKPLNFEILLSKIKAHRRIQELNNELTQKNQQLSRYNRSLERDQELAAHYFEKALKHSYLNPAVIRHHLSSASAFNGDLLMAAPRPGGGIYIILGDFTGHGLGASIGSLPVAQIFFNLTRHGAWIGDIALELNRELRSLLPDDMFLAATLVELNSTGERLEVWAGGLPDAYLIDSDKHSHRIIKSSYPPLGILDEDGFNPSTESYSVAQGEHLFLYTDGVIETKNLQGETYGSERLHNLFLQHEIDAFNQILRDIRDFIGQENQTDDTSFLELVCQPIEVNSGNVSSSQTGDASRTSIPFQLAIHLGDTELKSDLDAVSKLTELVCATALAAHKGVIHTILAEIYTNMLEHGLLNLDSRQKCDDRSFAAYYEQKHNTLMNSSDLLLQFNIEFFPGTPTSKLVIVASHNGNHRLEFKPAPEEEKQTLPCGRGMLLLQNLCEEVKISDDGKSLKVVYQI